LFFNTAGNPIPAVNCVSLGVQQGSLFGFLGANGAGKTTLIKMITSMLPPSDGTIEILGRDIAQYNDPTLLSICPQFNTHLCDELTPYEHFVMYSLLFQLTPEEAANEIDRLISILELEELKDQPIRELSGGDVRKLAIALSFLGPARIILLDEPTASLDAVARRHVHEMISSFKGEKTFMLCTHLLSEAESLCDNISIMIKGCVYTVGTPSYLSDKFGTEFKVDIMLTDENEDSAQGCDKFFEQRLPTAVLSIARPKARIYNVPAANITLPYLFTVMEEGKQSNCGFNYYTCSSSSLERVFMEIVHLSESGNDIGAGD
jgi:ABC-type multidrug transport system ATPase subunit